MRNKVEMERCDFSRKSDENLSERRYIFTIYPRDCKPKWSGDLKIEIECISIVVLCEDKVERAMQKPIVWFSKLVHIFLSPDISNSFSNIVFELFINPIAFGRSFNVTVK